MQVPVYNLGYVTIISVHAIPDLSTGVSPISLSRSLKNIRFYIQYAFSVTKKGLDSTSISSKWRFLSFPLKRRVGPYTVARPFPLCNVHTHRHVDWSSLHNALVQPHFITVVRYRIPFDWAFKIGYKLENRSARVIMHEY